MICDTCGEWAEMEDGQYWPRVHVFECNTCYDIRALKFQQWSNRN